eukprot:134171_1
MSFTFISAFCSFSSCLCAMFNSAELELELRCIENVCLMAQADHQPTAECKAAGPPKESTYIPKGIATKLGDLQIYEIGNGKKAIILMYDIFGWNEVNKNVFNFADQLAVTGGFTVIMPDFYRGEPWPVLEFPPQTELQQTAFKSWLDGIASDIVTRKDMYEKVLPHLYKSNIQSIGCIGFCWGGKQSFYMGQDAERFKCIASLHGAWIDAGKANALQVPVYYGPAEGDTSVKEIKAILDKKKFGSQCVYHGFVDQKHGFCAARGDWSNESTKQAVDSALKETIQFFKDNL